MSGSRRSLTSMSDLGPLPSGAVRSTAKRNMLTRVTFYGLIVIPTVLAVIFYGLVASPRYVSEARFIVRSASSSKIGGFDMLLQTFGLAKTVDDAYLIEKYLISRDAVAGLQASGINLRAVFSPKSADRLSRYPYFWRSDSEEGLYNYFLDHVQVTEDSVKGILTLQVITFKAEDSQRVVQALLHLAEDMVNRLNERAQRDTVNSSETEVHNAEANLIKVQSEISDFRNKEILIDPSANSVSVLDTVTTLSTDLAFASANLGELRTSSPSSPAIPGLTAKITSLQDRIRAERSKMAGGTDALSQKIATYEQLALRKDLANKSLASAIASLESARQDARRQHIYIEEVASPNLPDESTEPQRIRSIATIFIFGFALFAVIWIVSVGAGEHSQ